MDGTIVDNMAFHTAAWIEFFRRRGTDIDVHAFFLRTAGRLSREIMRDYVRPDLTDTECDALSDEKESIYQELYAPHLCTVPGFDALVAQAKARGIALAVATAAPDGNVAFTLDGLALRENFQVVVSAADVARGKPEPDAFLKAAEGCDVPPGQCVVFEDSPLGVQAAQRAGMRTVALTTTVPAAAFAGFDNVIAIVENFTQVSIDSLFGNTGGTLEKCA